MPTLDKKTIEEWMERSLDGDLSSHEEWLLEGELAGSPELEAEHRRSKGLVRVLTASRIGVREGFKEGVLAGLPATSWETRSARAWRLPAAILAGIAVALAAIALRTDPGTGGPLVGVLAAVASLLENAVVTGAGLLGASWKGLRLVANEALSSSPSALAGSVLILVALCFVLVRALRRRSGARVRLK